MIKLEGLAGIAEDEQIWLLKVFSLCSAESNLTVSKLSHDDDGKSLRVKYYFPSLFFLLHVVVQEPLWPHAASRGHCVQVQLSESRPAGIHNKVV